MLGRTLAHYEVLEEIGRGGMGVVYRARDTRLRREVALKVLSPALTGDAALRERLVREAQTAAGLSHPAISVVHEVGEAGGVTFIAMELVRGEPLSRLLARGELTPERALELALELAAGLAEGHARGVVHRDLKPGNVMVTESGHAKLIDFGLAKTLAARPAFDSGDDTPPRADSDHGRLVGTAAYMSPEQVRGRPVDARSDVFAFGALLFEMLTGRPAFLRENPVETLHAILKEDTRLPPHVPAGLRRVLAVCLHKEPARRYASAHELHDALCAARAEPGEAAPADSARTGGPSVAGALPASEPPPVPLRVAVVDDEEPARALLREYLAAQPGVELVAECRNGFEAVKAVSEHRPDLLFLDVQMPKLDGFEVLELIGREVAVVFVTAFDEYALRAFDVHAVDYLLKPVSAERFAMALERARRRVQAREPLPLGPLLADARPRERPLDRLLVRQGARVHVVPTEALDYAEAQDDYVALHSGGKAHLKQQTLGELEAALDARRFVRIHRSYLLNLDRLARLEREGKEARVAVLRDGTRLPVSRTGYARLRELL
jgi:two-component system LytT family response regulator